MEKVYKYLFLCLILTLWACKLNAQNQLQFKHLNVEQGLSNGSVTDIVQDSIGFIWIATKNGLNRFDGSNCKVYNQKNSNISSNDVSDLLIDSKDRMWIGTIGGGVNIYNPCLDSFITYKTNQTDKNSLSSNEVHAIFEDKTGNIWLGTENGLNLYIEEIQSFKSYINQNDSSTAPGKNSIWSIYEQENGNLWTGTYGRGLYRFDKSTEKFVLYSADAKSTIDFSSIFINFIFSFNQDELLIGTNGNGLIRLNTQNHVVTNFFQGTDFEGVSIIRTIWKDKNGNLWIGTDGQGIIKIGISGKKILKIENYLNDSQLQTSLSNNTVNSFFEDNQANIWIGTAWRGANIIKHEINDIRFFYSDAKGYNSSPVLSVYKESDDLWIGTDGEGLSIINENSNHARFFNKENKTSLGGDFVQCIKRGKNNIYWLGTFANGLVSYNSQTGKRIQYKREPNNKFSLPFNDVRDLIELQSGDLWVGTWGGGLSYFESGKQEFINYRHDSNIPNTISSDNVLSILSGDNGKLWIATYGGGLNCFEPDNKEFIHFVVDDSNPKSIGSNYVFSLLNDGIGNIWLGTKEGLNRFDIKTNEFEQFTIGNSTYSNTIVGLLQDNDGYIWMSTKEGIFRLNTETKKVNALPDIAEGFHINAAFKDQNGVLYFGSIDRVVSFNPKVFKQDNYLPSVKFIDFKLFNKSVGIGEKEVLKNQIYFENDITLKYTQTVITFDFAALKYPFSNNEQFEIKMEGFEDNWRNIGTQKTATFTNLSPGDYTFKVRRQIFDEEPINNNIAAVNIEILPPLWRTWWAYMFYFLMLIALLIAYRRYTLKWAGMKNELIFEKLQREQEDKLHQLKQRFFTNISHEIRTPLTLISGPLNKLLRFGNFNAGEQKQLSLIKNNTNRLLNLVNELLNFRKLETGNIKLKVNQSNIVDFINEIYLSYTQHAINKGINYQFEKQKNNIPIWFDKVQLEKAVYNLLSNAFKFSRQEDTIKVIVKQNSDFVFVIIKDSGTGISKEKLPHIFERFYQNEEDEAQNKGFGIGLSITKEIVELHSSSIEVISELTKGSEFTIKIPLGKNHLNDVDFVHESQDEESIESYSITQTKQELKESPDKEEFKGASILIVEDNAHIREYLNELLSNTYVVFEASNGKEGLEKAIEFVPDIVISDVMMPVMDGMSFCHQLKTDVRISHIPVILLTARTLIVDKIEGYETGADDYLTKPFNESILKVRIKNLLNNRKMLRDRFLKEGITNPKEITLNSPDEEFLSKLVSIVEDNIDIPEFSIDQLAKDIAMSHSSVYKKVKALTGMTTVGFVRDFRLKRAAQLLKQNKISIIDVSFKVGYTDRRHFSQEFKKKFGVNPSVYVKDNS